MAGRRVCAWHAVYVKMGRNFVPGLRTLKP